MFIKENICDGNCFCNCDNKDKYSELFEDEDSVWEDSDDNIASVIQEIMRNNKASY